MGPEMMQQFRDQAERFGTRFITDNVTKFEPGADGEPHTVWVEDEEYKARAVILAMGAEHKKLGVPGEEELGGRGVSYCATCDAAFYKDRTTIIVGGGDSAMEEAIFLAKFSSKVTIVHRRDEFRASKIMLERARSIENIEFLTPYTVDAFLAGDSGVLDRARAAQHRDRRDARAADVGRLHRGRPRAAVRDRRRHRRGQRRGLRPDRGQVHAHQRPRRLRRRRPRATTPTARPSPRPAPAARPRSTPSGTCATTPLSRPRPPSKAPATWPSSSGPRRALVAAALAAVALAGCGGGDDDEKQTRRSRRRPDTIEFSTPTFKDGGDDPGRQHLRRRRARRRRSSGARLPPGRDRARAGRRGPGRDRRHLHPLDGVRHRRLHRRGLAPDGQFPAGVKEGKNSAARPAGRRRARPRATTPTATLVLALRPTDREGRSGARGRAPTPDAASGRRARCEDAPASGTSPGPTSPAERATDRPAAAARRNRRLTRCAVSAGPTRRACTRAPGSANCPAGGRRRSTSACRVPGLLHRHALGLLRARSAASCATRRSTSLTEIAAERKTSSAGRRSAGSRVIFAEPPAADRRSGRRRPGPPACRAAR